MIENTELLPFIPSYRTRLALPCHTLKILTKIHHEDPDRQLRKTLSARGPRTDSE